LPLALPRLSTGLLGDILHLWDSRSARLAEGYNDSSYRCRGSS
jgi:hypothetical protein